MSLVCHLPPIVTAIHKMPLLLDGAMGTQLSKLGVNTGTDLWSAWALAHQPKAVYKVHAAYFAAGADIAITNTYQTSINAFTKAGFSQAQAQGFMRLAARLAKKARDDYRPHGFVAGSIGPYGAYLADGSEYTGHYHLQASQYVDFHRPRLEALVQEKVDILAIETMPNAAEIIHLAQWLHTHFAQMPFWISLSIADATHLRDGTRLAELVAKLDKIEQIGALGVNCCAMETITPALKTLRKHTDKPLIAYPNIGASYDPHSKTFHAPDTPQTLESYASQWLQLGVRILGGCCGTAPEDIKRLAPWVHED